MNLFVKEDFISHAGNPLTWKIECDALSNDDWECIAHMIVESESRRFSKVMGIPRGGKKLEEALQPYVSFGIYPVLVVDDVWTTGSSFKEFTQIQIIKQELDECGWFGWTAFARNPMPKNSTINALLRMGV